MMEAPLTGDILDRLDPEVKERLQKYFNEKSCLEIELKTKYERLRVDSEQKYFELEKLQLSDHIRLEAESKAAADLRLQVLDLEKKYGETTEKYRELQMRYFEKSEEWAQQEQSLARAKSCLEVERLELSELLDKRNREVDRLTGEWKQLSEQLNEAVKLRITAETQAGDAKSELVILQNRDSRLKQELYSLKQQNEWLNKEIQERLTDQMASKKEKTMKILELQGLLDDSILEAEQSKRSLETARARNVELSEQIEEYIQKLKDARDANTQLEEHYRDELLAQEKLIELYKHTSGESEHKVEELTKAVSELQNLLKQANEVYTELQTERERDNILSQEVINDRDERIASLEKELVNANELLEVSRSHERQLTSQDDAEIVSSAAATVSRLLKSGMTLTQIYSEYVKVCSALQSEKDENKRLGDYLERILQEIEEKAPIMKKQRIDYEKALEAVTRLTAQLDNAMMECERCRVTAENDHRRCAELTRENQRFKQQTLDLGRQVKLLLKELEESRGKIVQMAPDYEASVLSSSSLLISEKLVTFRNIEELQEQNQKLLTVVRELSDAQEEKEMQYGDTKVAELQQQLDMSLKEIEVMKESRQRQADMVESLVQQRDMYRILATQPAPSPKITPMKSTPVAESSITTAASPMVGLSVEQQLKAFEENKLALKELQEEMTTYRRERAENERILNEQLDKSKKEASELRLQNAKLASQLDFTGERFRIVQSNSESHHKEIESLKNKNSKLMESIAKHQQSVTMLQQELMSTQEKLTRSEVRCQNLASEKEVLENSEARLHFEMDTIRRNKQSRDELVIRLDSIQNNLERSDFEVKTRLTQQIEKLERENAVLRKKVDGTDEQQRAFVNTLERQLAETRLEVDRQHEQCSRLSNQLQTANEHLDFLKLDLSTAQEKLNSTEEKLASALASLQGAGSDDRQQYELTRYRDLLADSTREIASLKAKLEQSERDCEQHRSVAENVERSLHEHVEASDKFKWELEQRISDVTQVNEALQVRVSELESEIVRLSDDNATLVNENTLLIQEKDELAVRSRNADTALVNELAQVRSQLGDTAERLHQSQENEKAARMDSQQQAAEAKMAQEKYDQEMQSHAADIEHLNQVSQELMSVNEKMEKALSDVREAQNTLEASQASWVEVEHGLKSEMNKMITKLSDFETQNAELHQQLETMGEQMALLQSRQDTERDHMQNVADSIEDNSSSSVDQLLEVVRYLRKEKELVEARFELLQSETTRLRQQNANFKRQLETAEKALAEEQENSMVNLQTASHHSELMRKVERLNLLQDSNQQLVDENMRIKSELQDLATKTKQLEDDIGPLQDTCRDVTAQRDTFQKEIEILQVEVDRWKGRTNHLIEQCNKFDPEEHKRAIDERDQFKRQLMTLTEEDARSKAEISRCNSLLQSLQSELDEIKSGVEAKDADIEEKNKTIVQLRKIGRKYRMQAEEIQKEFDELKAKTVAFEESSQSDSVELRTQLTSLQQERDNLAVKLGSADQDKNEALKLAKELEEREAKLHEQIAKLSEENTSRRDEFESLNNEHQSLIALQKKENEDKTRIESENAGIVEDKKKLLATLQTAKQRLVALRSEKEQLEATCAELRKQTEAGSAAQTVQKTADLDKTNDMRVEISRLESELAEFQSARTTLQLENQLHLEAIEKLRRENVEMQQRIQLLQCQRELNASKILTGASPAKPTVSAPPVERSVPIGISAEQQQSSLRKANIRPMASQQIHVRSVQPVRSCATEPRAMASIRPMAAAVLSSSSNISTPMATVMPTTAAMSESEATQVLASVAPQSIQQRPTQQVQPVSSHFEEATVSSSEEQQQDALSWWPLEATTSTSSEHNSTTSGGTGLGKRPRDDAHVQEDGSSEQDAEAPPKRSKPQSASEMADTTEASNNAVVLPSAEIEREAASIAQIEVAVEPVVEVRREAEPVSTSLSSMEEHCRGALDTAQADYVRKLVSDATDQGPSSDDLPDYQEQPEQAALDFDMGPSTSHANRTPFSDDQPDDNGDQLANEDYHSGYGLYDAEQGIDDEDVILVDDDDAAYNDAAVRGANDEYHTSDDEPGNANDAGDNYQNQDEDYEIALEQGDEPDEGDEAYYGDDGGDDKEAEQEEDDADDVIIVDDSSSAGRSSGVGSRHQRAAEHGSTETGEHSRPDHAFSMAVTTSVPSQSHASLRPMVMPVGSATSSAMTVVPSSTSSARLPMPSVSAVVRQHHTLSGQQLAAISRSQLMPFLFGSESGFGGGEFGDDSIVPSTPTLQLPRRSDGFAEAVCSPQVQDEGFMFGSTEVTPHSELAHQEGVGVDDTRMDLSQFDEAGRSLASSQPSLDLPGGLFENVESGDEIQNDPMLLMSEAGDTGAMSHIPSTDEHQQLLNEQGRSSGSTSQEEQPSTSQQDRSTSSQDKQDLSQSQNKPKIQRIIWEPEPRSAGQSAVQPSVAGSGSVQGTVAPLMADLVHPISRRVGAARGSYQTASGSQPGYRGVQMRGSPRMSVQHGSAQMTPLTRQPGTSQPQRHPQVARRARGRGGAGPRGGYY